MIRSATRTICLCVWIACAPALALAVSASEAPGFLRVTLGGQDSGFQTSTEGTRLTLRFTSPPEISPEALRGKLGDYATSVTSANAGRDYIVTLRKPYRVRQFLSSNGAGFDIVNNTTSEAAQEQAAPPPPSPEKKPEEAAAKPAVEAPKVKKKQVPPTPTKTPEEAIAEAIAPAPPTPEPKPEKEKTEASAPGADEKTPPKKPEPEVKPKADAGPMLIGVESGTDGAQLVFPWEERIASALWQRGKDWWLAFASDRPMDIEQLRSVLPKELERITAYHAPGITLLRLESAGPVYLAAAQRQGSYYWYIPISRQPQPLAGNYAIRPVADASPPYLRVEAYDTAPPLHMSDPVRGDRLLVIPTFEAGRALMGPYANPQLAVIPAMQGIVIAQRAPEITSRATREGLLLMGPDGLSLSPSLPAAERTEETVPKAAPVSLMFPYARWKVAPKDFARVRAERMFALTSAPPALKAQTYDDLVTLYLGQGMPQEALSLLNYMQFYFPDYYRENGRALLRAAANFMMFRMGEAAGDIMSPELAELPETALWKDAISLFVPQILNPATTTAQAADNSEAAPTPSATVTPEFDYLAYDKDFIRFYPPAIRQKLAIVAADNYVANKEYSRAARTLESLNRDGLLEPVQEYAEYLLGKIAAESGKTAQAVELWKPLATQQKDLFIRARAAFSLASLEYNNGKRTLKETIATLEPLRVVWRGDTLEQSLLSYLGQLYLDDKDVISALRTWKDYTDNFPATAEALALKQKMAEIFEQWFDTEAELGLPALKSLALFYEFRDLTPIGARGDAMIQKLADRLARLDLLDRASALLEHQVKYRLEGEERSRVGAQLALLKLLDKEPQKAIDALESSGYGGLSPALAEARNRLAAMALSRVGKPEVALELLASDLSAEGKDLRLEILWEMKDWPNVINVAEDVLSSRPEIAAPLTPKETELLLRLALAYSFERDSTQLGYLRDYYTPLLANSPYRDIFTYITNDASPLDAEDFAIVARQISNTESFLKTFREKIAQGRLSSIGTEEKQPAKEEAPLSQSEKNKPLVPESAAPATALPPEPTTTPEAENTPQNAPVEIAPAQEATAGEAKTPSEPATEPPQTPPQSP